METSNLETHVFVEYAPIIIVILCFFLKNKIFVTFSQLQQAHKEIIEEIENRFLSLVAFREFEKRIEDNFNGMKKRFEESSKRFDKLDDNLEHIKDILIKKG